MKNKGFTLIELLVVIAIIGVLAGILFVFINPVDKIDSSKEAVVISDLSSVTVPIQIKYDTDEYSYDDICSIPSVVNLLSRYSTNRCTVSGEKWAIYIQSENGINYCLDNTTSAIKKNTTEIDSDNDGDCANS